MNFMVLQIWLSHSINIWQILGYLNLICCTGFLLFSGYKRGWDRTNWTLLVTAFVFGTGLGTILLPSIMGALLGGTVVFLIVKHLLKFQHETADLFTVYLVVFIGLGRLGCLFSGCCFGSVTDLPWGISYGLGNLPHWLHLHTGQITDLQSSSLPVHPVPLYESLFLLLGALPLILYAQRRKIKGKIILSGFISCYFLFRFSVEFIRDMSNVWWSEIYLGSVSLFQIFLLSIGALSLLYAYNLSRSTVPTDGAIKHPGFIPKIPESSVFYVIFLASILLSNRFQKIQVVLLLILLAGLIYLKVLAHLATQSDPNYRLSPQAIGVMTLLLIVSTNTFLASPDQEAAPLLSKSRWLYGINENNQKLVRIGDQDLSFSEYVRVRNVLRSQEGTFVEDSTLHMRAIEDLKKSRLTYSLGGSYTKFEYEKVSCGGESVTETVTSSSLIAGFDKEKTLSDRTSSYLNGRLEFTSASIQTGDEPLVDQSYALGLINMGLEREIIGVGIGIGLKTPQELDGIKMPIIPSYYLRLGPREIHLEAGLNDRYYVQPGYFNGHVSLGHKPTRGLGYQVGIGNRGPSLLSFGGPYATITNLQFSFLPKFDLSIQMLGDNIGFSTTPAVKFPR